MAPFDSPITSYSDTTPHKQVITDVISLIDPVDTPLITALGGLDGASGKFRFANWPSTKVEWLEDTHIAISAAMNESASITSTVTTITITDGTLFEKGHIIQIDSEMLWVSSVDVSNNIVTVTRGTGGSTAATHASTASVLMVGMARLEGADSDAIGFTDRTTGSNVTQIFHQEVKVTRTHSKLSQYGITDELAYQRDKAIPALTRLIERHLLYNKGASAGSATTPRIMGGIQAFVTSNKVSGASLAQSAFENAVLSAYNSGGGGPFIAIVNPANMQKIKNWYDPTATSTNVSVSVPIDQREVGMNVNRINTPFGQVDLVMDRWVPTTIIPILDVKHCGLLTYDPLGWEPLAKTGDYNREQVVGEFTFCLRQEKAHALLTAVS